jgi:CHRD domain-containing protein
MRAQLLITSALVACVATAALAADAGAATRAQYGAKCNAAWTGKRGTKAFRSYKRHCISAAIAATRAAHNAGNNDDPTANRGRAVAACRVQFPAPRNTRAKRKAFKACIAAVVAAEKQYGGRPLHATLAGSPTTDTDGAGSADLTLNQGHGQVCFNVTWTNLGNVTGVQVQAVADDSVVVTLTDDFTDGNGKGCTNGLTKKTIMTLRQHPDQYYVNVLTDEFATGAIRGTLHK